MLAIMCNRIISSDLLQLATVYFMFLLFVSKSMLAESGTIFVMSRTRCCCACGLNIGRSYVGSTVILQINYGAI